MYKDIFEAANQGVDTSRLSKDLGSKVKGKGPQKQGPCPLSGHEDKNPSYSVNDNIKNWYCHACKKGGTNVDLVMEVKQITALEAAKWITNKYNINYKDTSQKKKKSKIVDEYVYTDKNGRPLYKKLRTADKNFFYKRYENGSYEWGIKGVRRVLYRLPEVIEAEVVLYVEGEKDAETARKMGFTATTGGGAGDWRESFAETLKNKKVVIIPDQDQPGKKYAEEVAEALHGKAKIKILELPGLKEKEDLTDWINNGGTKEKLKQLIKDCQEWKPDSQQRSRGQKFEDFLPSPIAQEIIRQEKKKGRLWKYVAEKDLFYFYDTAGYWRNQEPQYLKKFIRQHLRQFNKKWDTNYRVNEVIAAMKSLLLDPENARLFDAGQEPDLQHINLKNGMLNWRTGELKPHQPDYYSQFQLPVKYDPEADCPRWKQALKEWKPEKEARQVLQEFVGYGLIPDTSMQKSIILHGSGSNGKSTFLEVISELFGRKNLSNIPMHRLSEKFVVAGIQDKLINVCPDLDPTYLKKTGVIKTIISGEEVNAEYKFGENFDFYPVARLIFSANEVPKSRDKSGAWYRRFEIIEFPNTFRKTDPDFDPNLKNKLKKELPGILNWAIKGLKRLKDQKHFTQSESIQEAKREYERENDTVVAFIEDSTKYPKENYEVCKTVYNAYKDYCEEAGLKYTTRRTFTRKLKQLGFEVKVKKIAGKSKRCYYGLKLEMENKNKINKKRGYGYG